MALSCPSSRLRKLGRLIGGLAALTGALAMPAALHAAKTPSRAPGQAAPHFTLPALHGIADSDSLAGHVLYVDFWASWCDPCRRSFPWMASMQQRFGPKGLTIVAIDLDKNRAAADKFLEEHPAPFVVAFDPSGETAEAFKVAAMPSSFLVSRSGEILHASAGFDPTKTRAMEALVEQACSP